MKAIAIAALLLSTSSVEPSAPLAPTGKWVVEYADNLCVLSRPYDTKKGRVILAVRPWPMGDSVELVLMQPGGYGVGVQNGKATVALGPSGTTIDGTYNAYYAAKTNNRLSTVDIPHTAMAVLANTTKIDIAMPGRLSVSLTLVNMKSALNALGTCTDDLLRSWHIDPAEQARIVTPPRPISEVSEWIGSDDYPADSLSRESQGRVDLLDDRHGRHR